MQNKTQESIVKSIIYGSPVQTTYGLFRSLCSAINHKDHIDKIIFYLRNNQNFQKYNKFVYAFRLEHAPNDLFITGENLGHREKFLEGYNHDAGLEGNGEKLLNLLKKFNVRNVLVIVAIRQKDPLKQFNSQHYVELVKCAKDLLSSLYDKVVMSKSVPHPEGQTEIVYEPIQPKQFQIPLNTFYPRKKKSENPNYVGRQHIKKRVEDKHKKLKGEMEYLNKKIEELANILEDIIEEFMDIEDTQVQFLIRYDKSKTIQKVFQIMAQLFGLQEPQDLIYQFQQQEGPSRISNYLRSITMRSLTSETIHKLNQEVLSSPKLRYQSVEKQNKICGILMQFIEVLLKSYSFARRLALIEAEVEEEKQTIEEQNDLVL